MPAPAAGRRSPPHEVEADARGASTFGRQRQIGYTMIGLSAAGIAGIGAWAVADSMLGIGDWAVRTVFHAVGVALIGLSLWALLNQQRTVPRVLMLGATATSLLVFEAGLAWWEDRARSLAKHTLLQLDQGGRDVESLTPVEMADPYVDAYVVMRDIHWELYARADDVMSRYRSRYEHYTAEGAFLDTGRLATTEDISRSLIEIDDLQLRLLLVETSRPDIADLLLTVDLLDVDPETRAGYADDVRAARDSFVEATAASVARERETLGDIRQALEALLDARGRYRIEDGRIIFEDPEDAARFAGEAEAG